MAVDTKRRLAQCRRTSAVGGGPEMATDCQTGAFDPTATSPLRHAGQAHTLKEALAPRKEGRIVTHSASSTANVESWIERKPCLCRSTRFLQRAEQRKCGGQLEMRDGIIPVGFEAPAQPCHCFNVGAKNQLGYASVEHPPKGIRIAGREPKSFLDMTLGFRASTN